MNLRDALLCIDCDEVFATEGFTCNPRCPSCGSSVFAPLAGWIQTWTAFEKSGRDEQGNALRCVHNKTEDGDRPPDAYCCVTPFSALKKWPTISESVTGQS